MSLQCTRCLFQRLGIGLRAALFSYFKDERERGMFMKDDNRLGSASAALVAVIILICGAFGQGSPVLAIEKKQKGGPSMASPEGPAAAGTASGYVSLNGVKLILNHAYALAQPNTFDEKKLDIAVLLTEKPLPEGALRDVQGMEYVTHKKHNYVLFKINDQGKPIYEVIEHPVLKDTRLMMSGFTWAEFASEAFGKGRIQGSFRTPAATDFSGYKYEINVKFSAQVQQANLPEPLPDAKTGKALPTGGGAPAKAYFAYRKAIETKDVAGIRRLFQLPAGVEVTDDEINESLDVMSAAAPKNLKLTKGYSNTAGDRAAVYFVGTEEGEKLYGTVRMIKKNDQWMVAEEVWSNVPPEK